MIDWTKKTCLVTGAFGFVGTHLCRDLISRNAKVVALDYLPTPDGTYFGAEGLHSRSSVLKADVRRMDELRILRDFEFDVVFHLAAQPISPLSNLSPDETIETNVTGTANVGKALSALPSMPVFVFASSACYYGATATSPLKEEDPYVEGEFTYSESKVLSEGEVLKMESLYGIPTIRCRFVNLYGPGDRHFSRIIPKTIRHLLRGEQPALTRNNGSTILDFMHVADAVSALITSAEHGRSVRGEVFNFGIAGDNPRSAFDMVKLVSRLYGRETDPLIFDPVVPRTKVKFLDNTKATQCLGWKPQEELEEGLLSTINWYRQNTNRIEHLDY